MPQEQPTQPGEKVQLKRAVIEVHGLVQDVNFRYIFHRHALNLRLRGEIFNDPENQNIVHLIIEGEKEKIEELVAILAQFQEMDHTIPNYNGEMAPIPSLTIEIDFFNLEWHDIEKYQYSKISMSHPELKDAAVVQVEILKKISSGGSIYQQFHRDHNQNFHILEGRYGSVSDGIKEAVQWIKIGTIAGLGMGAILIYVISTL